MCNLYVQKDFRNGLTNRYEFLGKVNHGQRAKPLCKKYKERGAEGGLRSSLEKIYSHKINNFFLIIISNRICGIGGI